MRPQGGLTILRGVTLAGEPGSLTRRPRCARVAGSFNGRTSDFGSDNGGFDSSSGCQLNDQRHCLKGIGPGAPRCRGWDAKDPDGCWMPKVPDYCHGFRLFEGYEDALEYAASLDTPSLLGFDTEEVA